MTSDQEKSCEVLADKYFKECQLECSRKESAYMSEGYEDGYKAAQSPDQLVLNPLVKELVRVLGMVTCVGSPYDEIINEALAPFKEVVE